MTASTETMRSSARGALPKPNPISSVAKTHPWGPGSRYRLWGRGNNSRNSARNHSLQKLFLSRRGCAPKFCGKRAIDFGDDLYPGDALHCKILDAGRDKANPVARM